MSLTITQTHPRPDRPSNAVRRQRVYDHLYDPVYTVSSEVDHARSSLKVYASKDRIKRVPEFGCMFSELPHHPRYTVQLQPADPVPAFIDRRWRGHAEQRREALQQLAGPLVPFAQQVAPQAIFASPQEDFIYSAGKNAQHAKQPTHVTVGVQTDYRESETQTDPYSPEYVVQPGTTPSELLQLAALTWGRGLPAGLAEVEMIERARAKRAWEATLPPLADLSQLDKRRRMMEQMEVNEWAFRDGEIQKLQEARLNVLKDLLRQRDEAQKEDTSERLMQIYSKLQQDKDTKLHKINHDHMRALRKLDAKGRHVVGKLERLSIVKNYPDIQTRAPRSRRDAFSNRNACNDELESRYLNTYEGLLEIEAGLSASRPEPRGRRLFENVIRPPASTAVEALNSYRALIEDKEGENQKALRLLVKKEKPAARPVTPRVEEPPEGVEETELAVIHLQKLLRGRSVQYKMFKGKENHLELIRELRTVHALQGAEQKLRDDDKELVVRLQKQMDEHRCEASRAEASWAGVVGAELERLFDTLSKELIHLQEERRIHAFTLLAERDRRLREAEESGRRQIEERRRREEDEIFRQVVQVHQETVDLYLEDIVLETLEQKADKQAREEIHRRAKEVNDIAYAMEERNSLQSEEIVSELIYSFLIPEVKKISVEQRVHQRQHRHLQAARSVVEGSAERSGILPSIPRTLQLTCPSERASDRVLEEMIGQVEQEKGKGKETE
ncbi:Protein MAATS1 [Liparis tanakae]|uniref:Cilia- and flagella-associated protein 91 n=1 Tax=Liparis tanakae TaxID=230148 RepID=A0A4Z2H125_9TELE|nr:Protein MAATS1 [Liparis tanakae]